MPGVTETGFEIKSFDQIKEDYEADFRDIFGSEINLSSTSLLGGVIGILSNNDSQLWELGSSVYLSRFVNTATGRSLDNNVNFLGLTRKQDFRTSGTVYIFGDVGTVIAEGTIFSSAENITFITVNRAEIATGVVPIIRISQLSGFSAPSVTLNPVDDLYGIFQPTGSPPVFNFNQNTDEIKEVLEGYFGEDTIESVAGVEQNSTRTAIVITFATNMFLPPLTSDGLSITFDQIGFANGVAVPVVAQEPGPIKIDAGQVNTIVNPLEGVERVINFDDFIQGRLPETDTELRRRWQNRVSAPITSTKDAMRNAIETLEGVSDAFVFDLEDNPQIPAASIDIVVNGGQEDEIAQVIYNTKPPGIRLSAQLSDQTVTANARDTLGNLKPIIFSRPEVVPATARVTLQKLSNFPDNGDNAIRQGLADYQAQLSIGAGVRPSPDLIWALDGISGINSLKVEISVKGGDFQTDPYQLQTQEILSFTSIIIIEEEG